MATILYGYGAYIWLYFLTMVIMAIVCIECDSGKPYMVLMDNLWLYYCYNGS